MPFARVPVWVLDRCTDSHAIHLYALLGKYTNREDHAWPATETLARKMNISVRSVERAISTLREIGALHTERRHRADGAVLGLDFWLVQVPPDETNLPAAGGIAAVDLPNEDPAKFAGHVRQTLPVEGPETGTGVPENMSHPATGVAAIPPPVAVISSIEPDPLEPDQGGGAGAARRYPPPAQNAEENIRVVTKIAHEVLDRYALTTGVDFGKIVEAVKRHCAAMQIVYCSAVVTSAINSACYQRRRAGKSSVLPGSAGEAAFRAGPRAAERQRLDANRALGRGWHCIHEPICSTSHVCVKRVLDDARGRRTGRV